MRTFDKAWRLAISHKKCSFCENPAIDYEKFKFYCQLCWDRKEKDKKNGTNSTNRSSN